MPFGKIKTIYNNQYGENHPKKIISALALTLILYYIIPSAHAAAFSATNNVYTFTNSIIDVGQTSVANTIFSGGSGGPYSGEWVWLLGNGANEVVNFAVGNSISGISTQPKYLSYSPSGNLLYVLTTSKLYTINALNNQTITSINSGGTPYSPIVVNPSDTIGYYTCCQFTNTNEIQVVNLQTGSIINSISFPTTPQDAILNPQGTYLYVTNSVANVYVINTATNTVVNTIGLSTTSTTMAINPSGSLLYVGLQNSNSIAVYNTVTTAQVNTITTATPTFLTFNPQGTLLYSVYYGGATINVINTATNTIVNSIGGLYTPVYVAFNPSGTLAYVDQATGTGVNPIDVVTNSLITGISVAGNNYQGQVDPMGTPYSVASYTDDTEFFVPTPESLIQGLPTVQSTNGLLQLTINAVSSNDMIFTFNGMQYNESTGASKTIYGAWTLFGLAQDTSNTVYVYGSNSLLLSNTLTINPALAVGALYSYNAVPSRGQTETITYQISGGTPPYTYNFMVVNSANGNVIANMIYTGVSSTSNSFMFTLPVTVNDIGSLTVTANVLDSASTPTNILASNTLTISSPTVTIAAANTLLDAGQYLKLTATPSEGFFTYTYNFLVVNSVTGVILANELFVGVSSAANTAIIQLPSTMTGNSIAANVIVTDSLGSTFNSIYANVGFNVIPSAGGITPNLPGIDVGKTVTLTANPSGGTQGTEYYVPITLTNNQGTATGTNFQQLLTINSMQYQSYINANWMNVEFTDGPASGNMLNAWVESNPTNTATNTVVWVLLDDSIGANSNEIIYMDFTANNVMSSAGPTGEAPQLSSTYGKYDNGNSVFAHYGGGGSAGWSQFTLINGAWTTINGYLQQTSSSGSYQGGPAAVIETANYLATGSYVIGMAFNYTTQASARVGIIAVATPTSNDIFGYRFIGEGSTNAAGFISFLNDQLAWAASKSYQGAVNTPYTMVISDNAGSWSGNLFSGYGTEITTPLTSLPATSYTTNNDKGTASGYVGISATYASSTTVANPMNIQWFYIRANPPNGVMPSSSFGSVSGGPSNNYFYQWYTISGSTAPSCTATNAISGATSPTFSASPASTNTYAYQVTDFANLPVSACSAGDTVTVNAVPSVSISSIPASPNTIDAGQTITFTAQASGGTGPFTYNFLVYNSATKALISNALYTSVSSTSNSFSFATNNNLFGNTINANVFITDADSDSANSVLTGTFSLNAQLAAVSLSALSTTPNQGQQDTVTYTISGGTPPYTYNFLIINSTNSGLIANTIVSTSSTSNTFSFTLPATSLDSGTLDVFANVVDSAPIPNNVVSEIQITAITPHSGGGGGSSSPTQSVTIQDNIANSANSNTSVVRTYLVNYNTKAVTPASFSQAQLPAVIQIPSADYLNFSYACSFAISSSTFNYAGTVYGLGTGSCGRNYTVYGSGSYEIIYEAYVPISVNSTKPANTTKTNSTKPITNTTKPVNTTKVTNQTANTTVPITNLTKPISLTPNLVIPLFNNTFTEYLNVKNGSYIEAIITNTTGTSPPPPPGTTKAISVGLYSQATFQEVNMTLSYPCNVPANGLAPYYYANKAWNKISNYTVNQTACTVSFIAVSASAYGIFSSSNSTSKPISSTAKPAGNSDYTIYIIVAVVIVVLVLVMAYLMRSKRR